MTVCLEKVMLRVEKIAEIDPIRDRNQLEKELLTTEVRRLREENEQLRVQLAGCGVAAMQNTRESITHRAEPGDYGYSASYTDVCKAVDREIRYREALEFARETFRDNLSRYEYKNEPMMLQAYEQCNNALRGGEVENG